MGSFYFIYRNIELGGGELLIFRMAKYLKKDGYSVCVLYNTISSEMYDQFTQAAIDIVYIEQWTGRDIAKECSGEKNFFFNLRDFLSVEMIMHGKTNNYFYVIHPLLMQPKWLENRKSIRWAFVKTFQRIICQLVQANKIIFMDEMCLNNSATYWGFIDQISTNLIYRLPMDDFEMADIERSCSSTFKILTVARADFPFKGYMKGLIEDVGKLSLDGYNIHLDVVTYGDGEKELQQWKSIVNKKVGKEVISVLGQISNNELPNVYKNTDLYVGMGTTVLEAARMSVPALVTAAYTYDFRTSGLFSSNPTILCAENSCDKGYNLLLEISKMEKPQYILLRSLSRQAFENFYSIHSFFEKLNASIVGKYKCIITLKMRLWLFLWYFYSLHRGEK